MLESIVAGMVGAGLILGIGLILKAAFQPDKITVKNGRRRGDGRHRGIIS